jgi:hypothetical protein
MDLDLLLERLDPAPVILLYADTLTLDNLQILCNPRVVDFTTGLARTNCPVTANNRASMPNARTWITTNLGTSIVTWTATKRAYEGALGVYRSLHALLVRGVA